MHPFCMLPVSLLYILYKFSNLNRTLVSNSCTVTLAFLVFITKPSYWIPSLNTLTPITLSSSN